MTEAPRYKRVLVKLSGESFSGAGGSGIEPALLGRVVQEVAAVREMGVEAALVVGGGNFVRGRDLMADASIRRTTADYMGMLATVMNGLALRDALEARGVPARLLGAIPMPPVCEPFAARRAIDHLQRGRVVIFAGGTGSPFFTTDTCASLRAAEISADALLKATKVDGVFNADPEKDPAARKYRRLTYQQVLADRLGVMDLAAVSMCMEVRIPIVVFEFSRPGSLAAAVRGADIGTLIAE